MNQREAKRRVCEAAAHQLLPLGDLPEWIWDEAFSDEDSQRLERAYMEPLQPRGREGGQRHSVSDT